MTTLQDIYDLNPSTFFHRINRELRSVAKDNPHHTYEKVGTQPLGRLVCKYNESGNPNCDMGCIFGEVFKRLGWTNKEEMDLMMQIADLIVMTIIDCNTEDVPETWIQIQHYQDAGETWYAVVSKYLEL